MNWTLIRLLQRVPGFQALAARLHPVWFFRATRWCMILAGCFGVRARRRVWIFRTSLRDRFPESDLRTRGRRYLFYSRLYKDLEILWSNWQDWHSDWLILEGESHLRSALDQGKGAVLISGHNFGFSKLVGPVLAGRGYQVFRGGNGGGRAAAKRSRWGDRAKVSWEYLDYGKDDYWHRVRLLRKVQNLLAVNEIVHVSPRGFQTGEQDMAMEIFGRRYFLDARWFRIFQMCQAPVLPCFVVGNGNDRVKVTIHPPLEPGETTAQQFGRILSDYITRFPECGRLWKNLYVHRRQW